MTPAAHSPLELVLLPSSTPSTPTLLVLLVVEKGGGRGRKSVLVGVVLVSSSWFLPVIEFQYRTQQVGSWVLRTGEDDLVVLLVLLLPVSIVHVAAIIIICPLTRSNKKDQAHDEE